MSTYGHLIVPDRYPLELVRILPGTQFFGKLKADQINEMLKCK